ncbi:MAG TPA: oligosaccharide flippase family protein [Phycisphaerales bacterium]|nr:oligosaccharide flippase family protein [Phycisphaerales bacterium]
MRLAMKASAVSAGGFALMQVLRFVQNLYVADQISVSAYGQVGLVMLVISGLMLLSDIGIATNVVQSRRGDDPVFLNTAYSMNVVRGGALWLIAAIIAFPFAASNHNPDLVGMLVIAASTTCIRGLSSSALWTATRHVQMHKITALNVGSEVIGFIVALVWVWQSPTAWALIGGSVAAASAFAIGSFFMGQRPKLEWESAAARELISFGVWLFLSTATYFAASQAERLLLGWTVTKDELGWFTMAFMLASAPTRAIQQLFEQVFFPLVSRLCRDDPARAMLQFRRVKLIAFGLACGAAIVCILGGPFAVEKLLDDKYKPSGWMLQLLGFRAALDILMGPTVNMLFASGQSKFAATGNVMRLAVLAPGLWITLRYFSLREAVWVLTLAPLAGYAATLHAVRRHLRAAFTLEWVTMIALIFLGGALGLMYKWMT